MRFPFLLRFQEISMRQHSLLFSAGGEGERHHAHGGPFAKDSDERSSAAEKQDQTEGKNRNMRSIEKRYHVGWILLLSSVLFSKIHSTSYSLFIHDPSSTVAGTGGKKPTLESDLAQRCFDRNMTHVHHARSHLTSPIFRYN